jgi:hypothetical protein
MTITKKVYEIKSLIFFNFFFFAFGFKLVPLSKITVYASSGDSTSYCLFTILKEK